jgi:hypothetical protein
MDVNLWYEIVWPDRQELFASPERVAEIEQRQPEFETIGRPIILCSPRKRGRESGVDAGEELDVVAEQDELLDVGAG